MSEIPPGSQAVLNLVFLLVFASFIVLCGPPSCAVMTAGTIAGVQAVDK